MNRQDILGPWQLISMEATSHEGGVFYPFGETPSGMIMYDSSGYMSYTAMRAGRPKSVSGDLYGGTPEEMKAAFEGFDAYCGTYELVLEEGVVTHRIETCRFPNWEGSDQVRFFQLSGNRLIIDTPPFQFRDTEWVVHVIFERPEGFSTSDLVGRAAA
jgi:hypothetical protein